MTSFFCNGFSGFSGCSSSVSPKNIINNANNHWLHPLKYTSTSRNDSKTALAISYLDSIDSPTDESNNSNNNNNYNYSPSPATNTPAYQTNPTFLSTPTYTGARPTSMSAMNANPPSPFMQRGTTQQVPSSSSSSSSSPSSSASPSLYNPLNSFQTNLNTNSNSNTISNTISNTNTNLNGNTQTVAQTQIPTPAPVPSWANPTTITTPTPTLSPTTGSKWEGLMGPGILSNVNDPTPTPMFPPGEPSSRSHRTIHTTPNSYNYETNQQTSTPTPTPSRWDPKMSSFSTSTGTGSSTPSSSSTTTTSPSTYASYTTNTNTNPTTPSYYTQNPTNNPYQQQEMTQQTQATQTLTPPFPNNHNPTYNNNQNNNKYHETSQIPPTFHHAPLSYFALHNLQSKGPRRNADVGQPHDSTRKLIGIDTMSAGSWWCKDGGWPSPNLRATTEIFYVLSGVGCVTDNDGTRHFFSQGDVVILPKNWSGRWDVLESIHKVWVVNDHPDLSHDSQSTEVIVQHYSNFAPQYLINENDAATTTTSTTTTTTSMNNNQPIVASRTFLDNGYMKVGVSTCSAGSSFPITELTSIEYYFILEGVAFLTNADGTSKRCVPGDTIVLPKGWTGYCDVVEPLKKLWVAID